MNMPHPCPFDLLVDRRWKCEVKVSQPNGTLEWKFNIHRHGQLNEDAVDLYIFRFEGVPTSKKAIHLLLPSPIGITTLAFTLRSLIETAAPRIADFLAFARGEYKRPDATIPALWAKPKKQKGNILKCSICGDSHTDLTGELLCMCEKD